jgi:hypothetical protein
MTTTTAEPSTTTVLSTSDASNPAAGGDASPKTSYASATANATKRTATTIDDTLHFNRVRGEPLFRSANFESAQRPVVQTLDHGLSGFVYAPATLSIKQVALAAIQQHQPATMDYFRAANCIALGFGLTEELEAALATGIDFQGIQIPIERLPAKPRKVHRLTLDRVPSVHPQRTCASICEVLGKYGEILEVVPLVWEGTTVRTHTWHVTMLAGGKEAPPHMLPVMGVDVFVDIPNVRRVCRYCKAEQHRPECRTGQREHAQRQRSTTTTTSTATPSMALAKPTPTTTSKPKARTPKAKVQPPAKKQKTATPAASTGAALTKTGRLQAPAGASNSEEHATAVEESSTTSSLPLTDSDLANTMDGVDIPSQPDGIYASRHAPGNQLYEVSDDEVELPLTTPMVVVEPLSPTSAGIFRTIGHHIFGTRSSDCDSDHN